MLYKIVVPVTFLSALIGQADGIGAKHALNSNILAQVEQAVEETEVVQTQEVEAEADDISKKDKKADKKKSKKESSSSSSSSSSDSDDKKHNKRRKGKDGKKLVQLRATQNAQSNENGSSETSTEN